MAKAGDGYIYVGGDYRNTFPPLGVFRWHPETGDFQVYYNSWQSISVGNNGQSNDYNALTNKPRINGKELKGNFTITAGDIGALSNTVKIPIKLSDLFNDSGFISETAIRSLVNDIVSALRQEINNRNYLTQENDPTVADWAKKSNKPSYSYTEIINTPDLNIYAKKSDTYTREEIDNKTSAVYRPKGNVADYSSLPSSGNQPGDVWQLLDTGAEYYWTIDGEWAYFGEEIDLSAYAKKSEVEDALKDKATQNQITIINNSLAGKVDKEAGKSLVSDTEIARLAKVDNYNDTAIKQDIETLEQNVAALQSDIGTIESNIDTALSEVE